MDPVRKQTGQYFASIHTRTNPNYVPPADTRSKLHKAWDATWNAVWMLLVFILFVAVCGGFLLIPIALGS
jgi:hypothetical protein